MFTDHTAFTYPWPLICVYCCIIRTLAVVNFALLHSKLPYGFLCYCVACAKVKNKKNNYCICVLNHEYGALLQIHGGGGGMSCHICSRSTNKKL